MFDAPQMNAWIKGASAYCCQTLKAFASNPVWTDNPIHNPIRARPKRSGPTLFRPARTAIGGGHGGLDRGRHGAEAATGQRTPEEAARRAELRANRIYRG